MSKMTLNVEFLTGTDIKDAVSEARQKALELDMAFICFNVKGTHFSIGSTCSVEKAVEQYHSGTRHVCCK